MTVDTQDTPLQAIIARRIAEDGPMSVGDYMALCLGHPRYGYYMGRDPFGARGDFITAPEVSQMFGEMIGLWALFCWRQMGLSGAPRLIELGAGRGTLLADAVRAIAQVEKTAALRDIDIVETSPVLRERQRQTLFKLGLAPRWSERLDEVPSGPFILIANEFLDCLPIRQWQVRSGRWHERMVGVQAGGRLGFGLAPVEASLDLSLPDASLAGEGMVYERSDAAHQLMRNMATRLKDGPGVALFIDYGASVSGFGDTLQAMKAHRYADPFEAPGEADLTVQVDFAALADTGRQAGASVGGPVTQAAFLARLGIEERARRLAAGKDETVQSEIEQALHRLTGAGEMGELFKVLCLGPPGAALPPF